MTGRRNKPRRNAPPPRNAPLTFPDRRFIVSIDELVNELTPRIRRALENSLDKPDQVEAVRSMVDKLTPPILEDTATRSPPREQPVEALVEHTGESKSDTLPAAPDEPPVIDGTAYTPLAERDPELAKTMQAAIERIAAQTPAQPANSLKAIPAQKTAPVAEESGAGEPKVAAPGIPLDVQFGQAGELAVELVLWLSRGILLGIGTVGGAALAVWALVETARSSGWLD